MGAANYLLLSKLSSWKFVCMVLGLCAAMAIASSAQTLTTLHNFAGHPNDGADPYAGLVQGGDGNFYGTTESGGANNDGTVFKMTADGTLTTLYSFAGSSDGREPTAALIQASDGNFYGTTQEGGSNGAGTVFKITPNGSLTTLHIFDPGQGDAGYPYAGLIQASDGNFYGTSTDGGTQHGNGTVFKITSAGTVTVLHSFACSDAAAAVLFGGLVAGQRWEFLRDNPRRRDRRQQQWHGFQNHSQRNLDYAA